MAVQDQEGAAGYSGPREQVHRQTLQETVCAQAQGRAGGHRGTSATCGCSFIVPSLSPVRRHGCSCCSACGWSESSDGEPAAVQGPVGTGRARGACTAEPRGPAGKPRSVISGPTWHQAEAVPTCGKDTVQPDGWAPGHSFQPQQRPGFTTVWMKGSWAGAKENPCLAS